MKLKQRAMRFVTDVIRSAVTTPRDERCVFPVRDLGRDIVCINGSTFFYADRN